MRRFRVLMIALFICGINITTNASDLKKIEQNLSSVTSSIDVTKMRIKDAKEIEYLPDLYFMLGELLVDKARISYSLKKEKNPTTPNEELDFSAEKQIRLEAIETYKLIEERYPRFASLDKVLFTEGQEYLLLNDSNQALKAFKKITDNFTKSDYFPRALIEIGNIFFDKKDFDFALDNYRKVINLPGKNKKLEMAYYKSALCYIHKDDFLNSMIHFDRAFSIMKDTKVENSEDIREEALIASVWPISELGPDKVGTYKLFLEPIKYYRKASLDKTVFRRVLNRLAKRMAIKLKNKESHLAYLELFRLSDDVDEKKDAMENFFLKGKDIKVDYYPPWVAVEIANTLWMVKQADLNKMASKIELPKYEAFFRDFTTTLHKTAMTSKRKDDLREVVKAYEKYLWIYAKSDYAPEIYLNMAEASFHAQDFIKGGEYYFQAAEFSKFKQKTSAKRKELLETAIQSYTQGFAQVEKLSSLEKIQGRAGFQKTANTFTKEFPKDPSLPSIKFNYAKSFYDEQNFAKAAEQLKLFIQSFPTNELTEQAAILLIDSFYIREDFQGVVREGQALQKNNSLTPALRAKMVQVVSQAQLKKVKSIAGEIGTKNYADKFLDFAKSNKGGGLNEPALFEAFLALKAGNDARIFEIGEQYLGQFGTNPRSKDVLVSLSQKAIISADYRRAASYLLAFGQRYKGEVTANEALAQAALLADQLGDSRESSQAYILIGDLKKAAEVQARAQKWDDLIKLSTNLTGASGLYYQGLATYRKGQTSEGLSLLKRAADSSASSDEEKMLIAHAGIIVAEQEVKEFQKMGKDESFSVPLLQKKIQAFQSIDASFQKIIASGAGQWVIAALMNEAKTNQQMAEFLKSAKPPAGMNPSSFQKMTQPQIAKYLGAANEIYSKCMVAAEDFEVFTKYVEGCHKKGQIEIYESMVNAPKIKSKSNPSKDWDKVKSELVKTPRALPVLRKAMLLALRDQDFSYAQAIAQRMIEINPQSGQALADLGICQIYASELDSAQASFVEGLKKEPKNSSALWALAGLYKKYSFEKKFNAIFKRAKAIGSPPSPVHPIMKIGGA